MFRSLVLTLRRPRTPHPLTFWERRGNQSERVTRARRVDPSKTLESSSAHANKNPRMALPWRRGSGMQTRQARMARAPLCSLKCLHDTLYTSVCTRGSVCFYSTRCHFNTEALQRLHFICIPTTKYCHHATCSFGGYITQQVNVLTSKLSLDGQFEL